MAKNNDVEIECGADGLGCLLIIGLTSVSISAGYIWGAAIGWLALGIFCLLLVAAQIANEVFGGRRP